MATLDDEGNQIEEQPNEELTEKIATEVYIVVCKNGGVTDVTEARSALGAEGVAYLDNHGFFPLLKSSLRDVLKLEVEKPSNRAQLRALVKVELCTDYKKSKCELSSDCPRLHVCPFFITGNCHYGERCRYRHNFEDVHEQEILIKHKLNGLDHASLVVVLRRVIFGSHIQVCPHYKSMNGSCPLGDACRKYHLCPWFAMQGRCRKGTLCHMSHSLQNENTRIISLQNLRRASVGAMLARVFANQFAKVQPKQPTVDEICGFHLKGNCQYGILCNRHRHNLPYLWQILVSLENGSEKWVDFPASYNQEIEQDYCDVNKDGSIEIKIPTITMSETAEEGIKLFIHFTDMVAKDDNETCIVRIRRLSTASWLLALPGDAYATCWTWYWTNDQNQWIPYDGGEANHSQERCDSSNEKLEESFLSGAETLTLPLNQNSYKIDLNSLQQTNIETGVSRKLRRRPTKFIGEHDLVDIASRANNRPSSLPSTHRHDTLPSEWTAAPTNEEVAFVLLDKSSNEYSQAEIEFRKTLSGNTIHKIERIQNVDLWESYSRKLSKLSRKLGRPPEVRRLFHGTSEDSAKAIGQQGFDWRLCGVHGTAYGKGSYFAINASYSNGYASNSQQGHKMMFLAKVIVGTYVVGNSSTVRPPPRNPIKPHELHDSCVDKQQNPTIFVIFDNDQAYPELLITYS